MRAAQERADALACPHPLALAHGGPHRLVRRPQRRLSRAAEPDGHHPPPRDPAGERHPARRHRAHRPPGAGGEVDPAVARRPRFRRWIPAAQHPRPPGTASSPDRPDPPGHREIRFPNRGIAVTGRVARPAPLSCGLPGVLGRGLFQRMGRGGCGRRAHLGKGGQPDQQSQQHDGSLRRTRGGASRSPLPRSAGTGRPGGRESAARAGARGGGLFHGRTVARFAVARGSWSGVVDNRPAADSSVTRTRGSGPHRKRGDPGGTGAAAKPFHARHRAREPVRTAFRHPHGLRAPHPRGAPVPGARGAAPGSRHPAGAVPLRGPVHCWCGPGDRADFARPATLTRWPRISVPGTVPVSTPEPSGRRVGGVRQAGASGLR